MRELAHFIGGRFAKGRSGRFGDIYNPATGEVQARVPLASRSEVRAAVETAAKAFREWSGVNPQRRARVMFDFKALVERNIDELAHLLSSEHGKVIADSRGDIQRGLEVIEFACGIPHLMKGEYTEGAGPGIDIYSMRQPLGVVAGIAPFNFPAMIPMWMFGVAIACGNTFICKPSEKDPSVPLRLAELFMEAGAPAGVLNVVHGDKEAVDAILEDPDLQAVSFVGSSAVAEYVYSHGTARGKRVQAMGGAKNHAIIMPDADLDQVTNELIGAGYGSAGERCMAISVAVPVTDKLADALVERLKPRVECLKVAPPTDPDADYGPMVTAEHRQKVLSYIELGVKEGADLVVDGRGFSLQGYENGFFLGGSLFDRVTPGMKTYRDEIFGPVLQVARAPDFDAALALPSNHQYGNGVAIFTRDGDCAREFASRVKVGMIGINIPIPVPLAYHSFGGWKRSAFGDVNQHGPEGVRFFTRIKTVTQRWPRGGLRERPDFSIPTMK
ncbi:MAG TPA: CoA-acylating methylmalonate-semialdehyde dehydrogenase [Rhizomicrobium sp.]|jgi:malonate-semialdehyde dehydrogenase (acetylating)/methylmalonate-semialdehyde dehydrogenase|nr:CoA-acylating methylmalonate-semialdehyde dehydrogenase [Rhizomicrobium sp.]